jgi:hypothetical protein
MRTWFAQAIAAGAEAGEFDRAADPERVAERVLAVCDGYGVRALLGDIPVEQARAEIWAVCAEELGLDPVPPA